MTDHAPDLPSASEPDAAIALVLDAIEDQPRFPETGLTVDTSIAGTQTQLRDRAEAMIAAAPGQADGYLVLGAACLAGETVGEAAMAFRIATALNPSSVQGWRGRGACSFFLGRHGAAEDQYRRARRAAGKGTRLLARIDRSLGCVQYAALQYDQALKSYDRALAADPDFVEAHRNRARTLLQRARFGEAAETYAHVHAMRPDFGEAIRHVGNIRLAEGDLQAALALFNEAASHNALKPEIFRSLADCFFLQGRHEEAVAALAKAGQCKGPRRHSIIPMMERLTEVPRVAAEPDDQAARLLARLDRALAVRPDVAGELGPTRGRLKMAAGDLAGALADLEPERGQSLRDGGATALSVLLLAAVGRIDDAIRLTDRAIADVPDGFPQAIGDLVRGVETDDEFVLGAIDDFQWQAAGIVLKGCVPSFVEVLTTSQVASSVHPSLIWARAHLVAISRTVDDAETDILRLVAGERLDGGIHNPVFASLWLTFERLATEGRFVEARRLVDLVLSEDAVLVAMVECLFDIHNRFPGWADLWTSQVFVHTDRLTTLIACEPAWETKLAAALLAASFLAQEDDTYDRFCRLAVNTYEHTRTRAPGRQRQAPRPDKIRVGYVVTDFSHQDFPPEQSILAHQDRSRFDVAVYHFTPSSLPQARRRGGGPPLLRNFDGLVRDLNDVGAEKAAALIAEDGIDVLFDVVGWWAPEVPRLFLKRPAPVQATWLGLGRPGKLGTIDYIIGTETLFDRALSARYPESFVRFEGNYIPPKPIAAAMPTPRAALGLNEAQFVYLAYHQPMKITGEALSLWFSVLAETPESVLLLPNVRADAILPLARRHGIDPDRLYVLQWVRAEMEHVARIGAADVYLDSFPFSAAGLTGIDAIYMNVPRITLAGPNLYSRFGAVLLGALGMDELICRSVDDYRELAIALYHDRARLARIKQKLATAVSAPGALDPLRVMRQLEAATAAMWDRHCRGLPPCDLDISADAAVRAHS